MKLIWPSILLIFLTSCKNGVPDEDEFIVFNCGAENKIGDDHKAVFENNGNEFHGAAAQTDEFVYSGKYSLRLDSVNKYGFSIAFTDVVVGEYFEISVRVRQEFRHGTLIAVLTGETENVLRTYDENFTADENGWKLHSLSFSVANPVDEIKFYTFSNNNLCYFDDFEIIRHAKRPPIEDTGLDKLTIFIPDSSNDILENYKSLAVKEAVIRSEYKQYVKAFIINGSDSLPIEMRLKGDWVDHLVSGKASYRIKTSDEGCFSRLRSFSIQHPKTRNYMHEWFLHRLCDAEGLLSTRYDFLPVEINGVSHGIYALEEHFDKHLLESRNRREGPILKMDESGFWALIADGDSIKKEKSFPYFAASFISCFKKGRTTRSDVLFSQFKLAAILLDRFKKLDEAPEELLDVVKAGKFYALMDLGNVHHGLAWHNRRFYYNPVIARLEYVGFDMQPGMEPIGKILATDIIERIDEKWHDEFLLDHNLLLSKDFRNSYTLNLKRFSRDRYLDSVFDVFEKEIKEKEKLMGYEVKNYGLNRDIYYQIAKKNREQLVPLDSLWDEYEKKHSTKKLKPRLQDFSPNESEFHLSDIALNCYRTKIDSLNYLIEIENFHLNEVKIIGYSIKANRDSVIRLETEETLSALGNDNIVPSVDLSLSQKAVRIYYRAENNRNLQSRNVFKWPKPKGVHPRVELSRKFRPNSKYYKIEGDTLRLNKGSYLVDELIYIPKGYKVKFEGGTFIEFINGGGLIMNDDVVMAGTEKEWVMFNAGDSTSQGITILGANKVKIKYTSISNMGTLDYKGWTLTGALTIYESDVEIYNLHFRNNNCEDALNTIRCNLDISWLRVSDSYGDGFDADFCKGTFDSSYFSNTGNDAIDFSGSEVDISVMNMINIGDKAVSAGECSNLRLEGIKIFGSMTGLASKDDSYIDANNIMITDSPIGIACFQKKPEFGPAHIDIRKCEYKNIDNLGIIELGSTAKWDGKDYRGFVKFDIDAMYARFENVQK